VPTFWPALWKKNCGKLLITQMLRCTIRLLGPGGILQFRIDVALYIDLHGVGGGVNIPFPALSMVRADLARYAPPPPRQ
jgi:hypothetical protein